jgi:hypothetical protein
MRETIEIVKAVRSNGAYSFSELIDSWINGNKSHVCKLIHQEYSWHEFADQMEASSIHPRVKTEILCSLIRLRESIF